MNQRGKYLGQRSSRSTVIEFQISPDTHLTNCSIWTTEVVGIGGEVVTGGDWAGGHPTISHLCRNNPTN